MLLFFYFSSSKSEPGEIAEKCINSLLTLAEQGEDMKNICPWCVNYMGEKTRHCFLCKKCIKYQEFHDNYINNCVGKNNFSLYMSFLNFLAINLGFKLMISIWGLFWIKGNNFKKTVGFIIIQILVVGAFITFIILKIINKTKMYNTLYYGNFILKDLNENDTKGNNLDVDVSNNVKNNNFNVQLPSFGETDRNV